LKNQHENPINANHLLKKSGRIEKGKLKIHKNDAIWAKVEIVSIFEHLPLP